MNARILVGTCSWADKTLIDSGWYPPQAKTPEDRLRYYADQFPVVEVDSTYYGIPTEQNAGLWVERTSADFVFDIKAYSLFTMHPTPLRSLPKDLKEELPPQPQGKTRLYERDVPADIVSELWKRFAQALLPLDSAGKLGVVLFQFPPWFLPNRNNRQYIESVKERLPQYTMAVEFRNSLWLADEGLERTLSFLQENQIPLVCVDEPQGFSSSLPPIAAVTAAASIVRFHGRNRETWTKKMSTAAERFDYLYSEEELHEWLPRIRSLGEGAEEVHVLMNNCQRDYAVRNASQMARLLHQQQPEPEAGQQRLL